MLSNASGGDVLTSHWLKSGLFHQCVIFAFLSASACRAKYFDTKVEGSGTFWNLFTANFLEDLYTGTIYDSHSDDRVPDQHCSVPESEDVQIQAMQVSHRDVGGLMHVQYVTYNVNIPFLQNERNYHFLKQWENVRSCCPTETIEEHYIFRRFSERIRWRHDFDYARSRALRMWASFHLCLIAP